MSTRKFLFDPDSVRELAPTPFVGLPNGLPFVLSDEFESVADINDWLRSLQTRGSHSPRTWSGYADDLIAWSRFLSARGMGLLDSAETLERAVASYRDLRLSGGPESEFRTIGPAAWNRTVAALENFYSWALENRRIEAKPFRYRLMYGAPGMVLRGNTAKNMAKARRGSKLATLKHLAPDFADLFVEAGLGGGHPAGGADLAFRGRLGVRNRSLGHLVRASGLRRQEFSNLLVWETPTRLDRFSDYRSLQVPAPIAKGNRARSTWITRDALEAVNSYIDLERKAATFESEWTPPNPLQVERPDPEGGTIAGRRISWSKLTIDQRRRLVMPHGGSALLFVNSRGGPVAEQNWRYTFDEAVARCRQFVPEFPSVSPHTLRHTFALETLRTLTRKAMSRAQLLARVSGEDPLLLAVLRRNDPLLILRDLLGHQSVQTTEIYLAAQDPASILSDAEIAMLEDELGKEELQRELIS